MATDMTNTMGRRDATTKGSRAAITTTIPERVARAYRNHRRDGKTARHAWFIAKNAHEWNTRVHWTGEGAWHEVEHDGHTYRVALTPDDDAWYHYGEDRENGFLTDDEQPDYAYWQVAIETEHGEHVDALGGIAGGRIDDRGYADEDDELYAYVWSDIVRPAIEQHARDDRDMWARHLTTMGSE